MRSWEVSARGHGSECWPLITTRCLKLGCLYRCRWWIEFVFILSLDLFLHWNSSPKTLALPGYFDLGVPIPIIFLVFAAAKERALWRFH